MDRLISEQKVLEAVDKVCCGSIEYRVIYDRCEELIKDIPTAEPKCESCELNRQRFMQTLDVAFELGKASAEPYKDMTNGEVLEAVFPNIDFGIKEFDDSIWVDMEDIASFRLDWWNSPYEPQESEERTDGR